MTRRRILHITADFPDAFSIRKTEAVRNLVEGTQELDHLVYSINRCTGFGGISVRNGGTDLTTIVYRAPPYGIILDGFLKPVADLIVQDIRRRSLTVNVVHAHKLTIEGLAARRVAHALGCPFVCTVRGNTDQKYIRLRPDLRAAWRRVAQEAAWLFPVTPWIERYMIDTLALRDPPRSLLPTITKINRFLPPRTTKMHLVTAFHLAGWRPKGMPNLLRALARLKSEGLCLALDIVGDAENDAALTLGREIRRHGLQDQVKLVGAVSHDRMLEVLNGYSGFVLPTMRETFGMVYVEALFAGVPILYSQDRGIDGFFDGLDVGVRCDPRQVESIVEGLKDLRAGEGWMKQAIAGLQQEGGLDRFHQRYICKDYADRIRAVLEGHSGGDRS